MKTEVVCPYDFSTFKGLLEIHCFLPRIYWFVMIADLATPTIKCRKADLPHKPFWSVVIPTYNPTKEMLKSALQSILNQDLGPEEMEIIVIDDCSPNGSPEAWVKDWTGGRVKVINNSYNRGLAKIWNFCIETSCGQWIHLLHQDDVVVPGYYESLQKGIEASPEVGAAFSRFSYIDEAGKEIRKGPLEQEDPGVLDDFLEELVTRDVHIVCASISVRRETYESLGGFRTDLCHALDWEMWIRIVNSYPIYYHPEVMASWRQHKSAMTSSQIKTGENVRDIGRAIRVWREYLIASNRKTLAKESSSYWANCGLKIAQRFYKQSNYRSSHALISASLSCRFSLKILCKSSVLYMRILKSLLQGR